MRQDARYECQIEWTGNRGLGTKSYTSYDRTWDIITPGKPVIHCSNDPALGGDPTKSNPEDLLLCALSACHMLWFLHFASDADLTVHRYLDKPVARGELQANGAGRFISATLRPHISVSEGTDLSVADQMHDQIHGVCFIARSVNFPVAYQAKYDFVE
ncbi:MAG: OsmC family protein [Pseudomonadota bacterium]